MKYNLRYSLRYTIIAALFCALQASEATASELSSLDSEYSPVFSPDIPGSVALCGKKVELDRNDMYERFDRELTSLIYSHWSTLLILKRANKYFPVIAPILKTNGMPLDMVYLACIESTLDPRAYSPAKAAGLWQFMPATAKQYGLEVSDEVDERYNVEKATEAACRYLMKAYEKYHDWATVMASYNAGMNRISTELDKQISDNTFDLYLNPETSRYVFRIMALKTLMENPGAYGYHLEPEQFYRKTECRTVKVSTPVEDWATWAKEQGISYAQLKEENPWIRSRSLTNKAGKTYEVKIPLKDSLYRSKQEVKVYDKNWVK